MGYHVKIGSLREYTLLMNELAQNINPDLYVAKHGQIELWDEGYLSIFTQTHNTMTERVDKQLKRIYGYDALLYRSAQGLADTQELYGENEDKGSDRFKEIDAADRAIGPAHRPRHEVLPPRQRNAFGLPSYSPHFPYHADRDPLAGDAGRLLDSKPSVPEVDDNPDAEDPNDPLLYIKKAVDWFSPTHVINKGIQYLVGVDLVNEISSVFGGDWKAWWRCSDVWRRVGETHALVAHEVWRGNARLDPDWNGNAADSAYAYFHRLAFALKALKTPYDKLQAAYRSAAVYVEKASGLVADLLKELGDNAIIALLSLTPAAEPLLAAKTVKKVVDVIKKIQLSIQVYDRILHGVARLIAGVQMLMIDLEQKLPEPYEMPAAYRKIHG